MTVSGKARVISRKTKANLTFSQGQETKDRKPRTGNQGQETKLVQTRARDEMFFVCFLNFSAASL